MKQKIYFFFVLLGILISPKLNASSFPQPSELREIKRDVPEIILAEKEKAFQDILKGIKLAQTNEDDSSVAFLLNQKGIYHYLNADYGKSVACIDSAIAINQEYGLSNRLVENLNNKGHIYKIVGNYKSALSHFQEASRICDSLRLYNQIPITLTNLGNIHSLLKNHFTAIDYFERAARIAIKEGQGVQLANVYHNLGETYADKKEYENAIFYFDKVTKLADNASIPFDPTNTFARMAEVMKKQGRIDQALFYHQQVLDITRKKGLKVGEINSLIKIGNCYFAKNDIKKAERYLVEGIFEATVIQRVDILDDAHFTLSKIYEAKGDYKQALKLNRLGAILQDSLSNSETKRQLLEMQMLFAREKQMKDNVLLQKENQISRAKLTNNTNAIIFLAIGMILLILLAILFNAFASVKSDQNKKLSKEVSKRTADLEHKEKILSAQNKKLMSYAHMTSHVLRKPLANILGVINLLEAHEEDDEHTKDEMIQVIKDAAIEMDETVIHSIEILNEDFLGNTDEETVKKTYNPVRDELAALHQN